MSFLGAIDDYVSDLVRDVFRTLRLLGDSREQIKMVTKDQGGAGFTADQLQRFAELELIEDKAQFLKEALLVVKSVHSAIINTIPNDDPRLQSTSKADLAFELIWRMWFPAFGMAVRRGQKRPTLSLVLDMIGLIDDKLAENAHGFTAGRIVDFIKQGIGKSYDHQPWQLLLPETLPIGIFLLLKGIGRIAPHYDIALNAGWESEYLDRAYGQPESWRPTPVWIAQRTTSVEISPPKKFKLARYLNALPQEEPDQYYSLIVVPVPAKRVWTGDPAHGPGEIADTQGPAMYLQFEVAGEHTWTRGNWTLELRGEVDHGFEWPIGGTADVDYSAGAGAEVELRWTSPPLPAGAVDDRVFAADSISVLGFAGGGVTTNGFSSGDAGIGLRIAKARVTLQPDGGILKTILREPLKLAFDAGLMLTTQGFVLEGANGLDLFVPFKKPAHSPFALSYLRISAIYEHKKITVQAFDQDVTTNTTEVGGQLTAGVQLSAGPLTLLLDGIGVKAVASTSHPGGKLAGIGDFDVSLVKPNGLGVKIEYGTFVHGGGFFAYDSKLERYSGAVELGFGQDNPTSVAPKPKFVLRGVGFWEPQRDATGKVLEDAPPSGLALVTGEFAKWGIGGLVAVHRGMDLEAMRTAMVSGGADALLFPPDPVANVTSIIASLATMFPPSLPGADKHVLGVLGKLVWAGGFATLSVGVLAEWAGSWKAWPDKVAVPFSLRVGKSGTLARFLWIEVDGVGSYDDGLDEWELHAELHNSRLFGTDFVGGLTLFHGNPTPEDKNAPKETFLSLGGYHPAYFGGKGPGRAAVANRLAIVMTRGNAVRFEVAFYLAYSPPGFQFGISGHLLVQEAGFKLEGKVWIDSLFHSWDSFVIDAGGSVALILFDETITELELRGQLVRTDKLHFAGSVTVSLLWWSHTFHTKRPLSDALDAYGANTNQVQQQLADAVSAQESYPNAYPGQIALANVERPGIWNAPEQSLTFVQKVVPLDMPIARIGGVPLPANATFALGPVSIEGQGKQPAYAQSQFAPAAFLDLDTDAALHAPAGELWPAGFIAGDELAIGDEVGAIGQLDEITIDRKQLHPKPQRYFVSVQLLAGLRAPGVPAAPAPIAVQPARFVAAAGMAPTTFGAAWATRGTTLRRSEGVE